MTQENQTHGQWSSRIAFILAASGSAIGLGNIWKFPYLVGENGGGAFVLVYLACVVVIGIPIMIAETMLGRLGRKSPINTMRKLSAEFHAHPLWRLVGWLGVVAGFLILSYYSVIAGWSMAYILKMAGGFLKDVNSVSAQNIFLDLKSSPDVMIVWHTVFMVGTMLIVKMGVSKGLEASTRYLMPALFLMLLVLDGFAMTTGSFMDGISFLFRADISKLDGETLLTAMGQAFFSLGLGMGSIMVYGSYLPDHVSIPRASVIVAAADTAVALLAGIAIFPVVFANQLEPSMGPGLIFETLPLAFSHMPAGNLFGTLFFVLVFFAAITSAIALIEPAVAYLAENRSMSRARACAWSGLVCWILGLGTVFSFSNRSNEIEHGKNFFETVDFLTADIMLPVGAILIALFCGWVVKREVSEADLEMGSTYTVWRFMIRYLAPLGVAMIFFRAMKII